jgi:hypothetical protein
MKSNRSATTCRWAVPTLFQPAPIWMESWGRPWTCVRDAQAQPLDTTEVCADCPRWDARDDAESAGGPTPRLNPTDA